MNPPENPREPVQTPRSACDALHRDLDAAMAESAPLAWKWAPQTCHRNPQDGTTCAPYHRVWQYLLLLGITKSLRTDTAFLLDAFRRLASTGSTRVQISATADYGLLAHVLRAYEIEGVEPEVTVLDRCETSLELNRWYAKRFGATISTVQGDAVEYDAPGSFDVICAHSFLSWVPPEAQLKMVSTWGRNLSPGGHLITTKRLRPESKYGTVKHYGEMEALAFREKARKVAVEHSGRINISPEILADAALDYALSYARYPIASNEALCDLIARGGMTVVTLDDSEETAPSEDRPVSGPTQGAGKRVRVIARRDVAG